jgi:hypothetical protein
MSLTARERREVGAANASGRPPVVFVHGLWMLASSWDSWRTLFEENGYSTLAPGWPDDPETVEEARAHPEVLAGKHIRQIVDHLAEVIAALDGKPAVIGHQPASPEFLPWSRPRRTVRTSGGSWLGAVTVPLRSRWVGARHCPAMIHQTRPRSASCSPSC